MIWGWLPCGLVYAALAVAVTTGDVLKSSLTMLAFGVGTLPAVVGVGIITQSFINYLRKPFFKKFVGILMILLALAAAFPWLYPMRIQHH
jgi:sulfite exporter TauE/SafE